MRSRDSREENIFVNKNDAGGGSEVTTSEATSVVCFTWLLVLWLVLIK